MTIRYRILPALCSLSALSLTLLAGCGENPEPATSPSTAPSAEASESPAESPSAAPSGELGKEAPASSKGMMGPPEPPSTAEVEPKGDPVNLPPTPFKAAGKPVKTKSGLQYIDMTVGTGPSPKQGQNVKMQYVGWDSTGAIFDSSYKRNQPFEFAIGTGQVIPGWDEGVISMKVGGRRKLIIPPSLAYGGRPGMPFDNEHDIIFDVVLEGAQ